MMVEVGLVRYFNKTLALSVGDECHVEFDFDTVWAKVKKESLNASELEWIHVHPPGVGWKASHQDDLCAQALKAAFGTLGHFFIVSFVNAEPDDISGATSLWRLGEEEANKGMLELVSLNPNEDNAIVRGLKWASLAAANVQEEAIA